MDRQHFEQWMHALTQAWEQRDAEAAGVLFTENATYHENPFEDPLRGRAAIQR